MGCGQTDQAVAVVCEFLDMYLVDQLVIGMAKLPRKLGKDLLAGYQNGLIQFYAAVSALSVACSAVDPAASCLVKCSLDPGTDSDARRGMIDGDTPGDHGPASAAWAAWSCSGAAAGRGVRHVAIALGCALATLAFSLILLVSFRTGVTGSAIRLRSPGGALRVCAGWRPARHPLRPRAGRPQPLAVPADVAADDHGRSSRRGSRSRNGPPLTTPFCWRSRRGSWGSSPASTWSSSTSSSSSR